MSSIKSALIIVLFAALVAGVYMYATGDLKFDPNEKNDGPNNSGFMTTEAEFRTKLAELRIEQDKMRRRKERMIENKDEIVQELKDKGITSTSEITERDVKFKVANLKKAVSGIKVVDKSIDKYQDGIDAIESMLTKLEQDRLSKDVEISEEKAEELSIMLLDLDEKLTEDDDVLEEEALRELLGLELGK